MVPGKDGNGPWKRWQWSRDGWEWSVEGVVMVPRRGGGPEAAIFGMIQALHVTE